jgi:hypothetical protein
MNLMIASGGYPWTSIRAEHMSAHELAIAHQEIAQFADLFSVSLNSNWPGKK